MNPIDIRIQSNKEGVPDYEVINSPSEFYHKDSKTTGKNSKQSELES